MNFYEALERIYPIYISCLLMTKVSHIFSLSFSRGDGVLPLHQHREVGALLSSPLGEFLCAGVGVKLTEVSSPQVKCTENLSSPHTWHQLFQPAGGGW